MGVRLRNLQLKIESLKVMELYSLCFRNASSICEEEDFLFYNQKKVRHFIELENKAILLDLEQGQR